MIRAAAIASPGASVELLELPVPRLEPGAALLRTLYSEVCGTDVHLRHGRLTGVPYPLVPGHVSIGCIEQLGGTVLDVEGRAFREGDLVTFLDVHETCNACYACLVAKQTTRCPKRKVYGITYGAADGPLGGWATHIWMKPGVKMIRLPEGLAPEAFIGGGCGLVTALHAIDRAEIRLGQSVAVLGAGPVGQSVIALARLSGAGEVIAIDREASRLEYAGRMGASEAHLLRRQSHDGTTARRHDVELVSSLGADIGPLTRGRGVDLSTEARSAKVDVAIEASGAPEAVSMALDMVRDGGRVVICGHYTDNGAVEIHPHFQVNRKHVEIRGVWGCDYSHFHRAVEIVARHGAAVPWAEMVSRTYPLDKAGDALAAVERREVLKALIAPNG
jgi:D-arabinose 1-dehydrogenase-like Zn-dependent alcohol dehydrogenase